MEKCLALLVLVVAGAVYSISLDPNTRSALAGHGSATIKTTITTEAATVKAEYEAALLLFKKANETCTGIAAAALTGCKDCVAEKCRARGEDVCSSALGDFINFWEDDFVDFWEDDFAGFWEDDFINFWADDFANFFEDDVADFFTDDFTNAFKSLGNSLESGFIDVGDGLDSAFSAIGNAIEAAASDVGDAFVDIGDFFSDEFANFFVDEFANFFADDFANFFEDDFAGAFEDIGGFFSDLFGKRRRRSLGKRLAGDFAKSRIQRMKRATEPSCDEIQDDPSSACLYYIDQCSDCSFNPDDDCTGYAVSKQEAIDAAAAGAWISALSKSDDYSYGITSVDFDYGNLNHATNKFANVDCTVSFFGTTLSFNLTEAVIPHNVEVTGPIIAQHAIDEYKKGF